MEQFSHVFYNIEAKERAFCVVPTAVDEWQGAVLVSSVGPAAAAAGSV